MRTMLKKEGKNLVLLLVGILIYDIGTHAFVEPAQVAPGGAIGVALLVNHLTNLPIGMMTMATNIPLLILAWFYLSRRFAVTTAVTTALSSLVLDVLVAPLCPVYTGDRFLCSLYGGVVIGVGMALIFLAGTTTGGSDILGYLLQKKRPQMSIGRALLLVDGIVLVVSIFVFGNIDAALFGLVHMNWVQGGYAFALGFLLGIVYKKSGSLAAPMLMHMFFNFCGTYLATALTGVPLAVNILLLVLGPVCIGVGLRMTCLGPQWGERQEW